MHDTNSTAHIKIRETLASVTLACHGEPNRIHGSEGSWPLSEVGFSQANGLQLTLSGRHFDLTMSADTDAAANTGLIATGKTIRTVIPFTITLNPEAPINRLMRDESLGQAPLIGSRAEEMSYFGHEYGEHVQIWGRQALRRLLIEADALVQDNIRTQLESSPTAQRRPIHVFICSQSLACSALTWAMLEHDGYGVEDMQNAVIRHRLGHCEALQTIWTTHGALTTLLKPDVLQPQTN